MKFITISLFTILNLFSYTLAAPASNINPYIPNISSKQGNSAPFTKKDIPLFKNYTSPILTISNSISNLQNTIAPDLQSLNSLTSSSATAQTITSSLFNIATAINSSISVISPAVKGTVASVNDDEITELIASLTQVDEVVNGVEAGLMDILSFITDDVKGTVKTPIITLLSLITPLTSPLTGFAFGVAGTVASTNGTTAEGIRYGAEEVVNAATLLVSPVGPVLDSLL